MTKEAPDELENFYLEPFEMKVQGIDRTLVDKVFAICDYYMRNRVKKHSRHIYDICNYIRVLPFSQKPVAKSPHYTYNKIEYLFLFG